MSQEYIDAFYGHQSTFVHAKQENNHAFVGKLLNIYSCINRKYPKKMIITKL